MFAGRDCSSIKQCMWPVETKIDNKNGSGAIVSRILLYIYTGFNGANLANIKTPLHYLG